MELIGTVVRLQVQRSRLKVGPATTRVYNPEPLQQVAALELTTRGVVGDGIVDVHHADHHDTRNVKLRNGLSVMTVSRYRVLRERFGPHVVDGIAGESILLDTEHLEDLTGDLVLDEIPVTSEPAPPCVEFSRFVIGRDAGDVGPEVLATMAELGDGARGYYLTTKATATLRAGSRLVRP